MNSCSWDRSTRRWIYGLGTAAVLAAGGIAAGELGPCYDDLHGPPRSACGMLGVVDDPNDPCDIIITANGVVYEVKISSTGKDGFSSTPVMCMYRRGVEVLGFCTWPSSMTFTSWANSKRASGNPCGDSPEDPEDPR